MGGASTPFTTTYSVPASERLNYAQVPLDISGWDYTSVTSLLATCAPDPYPKHATITDSGTSNHATVQNTATPEHNQAGLSAGEKTGIGVGVGVGCVALLTLGALGAFLWLRRGRSKDTGDSKGRGETSASPYELEHSAATKEMPTGREAHEMSPHSQRAELEESYGRPRGIESRHELPID